MLANFGNDNVSILLGNGNGIFTPNDFPVGGGPTSVAVGDFNDDTDLDLAIANSVDSNVSILLGCISKINHAKFEISFFEPTCYALFRKLKNCRSI